MSWKQRRPQKRKVYILDASLRVTFAYENGEGELDTAALVLPQRDQQGNVVAPLKVTREGLLEALKAVEQARRQLEEPPPEAEDNGE